MQTRLLNATMGLLLASTLAASTGCGVSDGSAGLAQLASDRQPWLAGDGVGGEDARDAADTAGGEDTAGPGDTVNPIDTAGPGDTVNPVDTAGPGDTVNPDDTPGPGDTVNPVDTAGPGDTVNPNDTAGPGDTVNPVDTTSPGDTVNFVDTTTPGDTVGPTDTTAPGCLVAGDCVGALSPGVCERAACVDYACVVVRDIEGAPCDDHDPCTRTDRCSAGACHGADPYPCCDHDACTTDTCVAGVGCVFAPVTCPVPTGPCRVSKCDPVFGCGVGNAPGGTGCDDGDPCTTADACTAGACAGDPLSCADQDACTADACVAGDCRHTALVCDDADACTHDACVAGGCQFTALACDDANPCTADACAGGDCVHVPLPGCGVSAVCVNQDAGFGCDDGDPTTLGDLCLAGVCRGFVQTRVAASAVPGQQGLVISEVDEHQGAWWSVLWSADADNVQRWSLGDLTDPALPVVVNGTTRTVPFAGLGRGFVGDGEGRLWRESGTWSPTNAWDSGVALSGRGVVHGAWVDPGGAALWLIGQLGADEWIRACARSSAGAVSCSAQDLDDHEDSSIPLAIGGLRRTCATGDNDCLALELVLGADGPSNTTSLTYKDTFVNPDGALATWETGFIPTQATAQRTTAVVGWGAGDFLVVGTGNYVRHRRPDGEWSGNLSSLKPSASGRDFNGAWAGSGVIALAASRQSDGQVRYELWTCPDTKNPESGANWTVHPLGVAAWAPAAGLYDVHGAADGELRVVGASVRPGAGGWLDGIVFVRGVGGL